MKFFAYILFALFCTIQAFPKLIDIGVQKNNNNIPSGISVKLGPLHGELGIGNSKQDESHSSSTEVSTTTDEQITTVILDREWTLLY